MQHALDYSFEPEVGGRSEGSNSRIWKCTPLVPPERFNEIVRTMALDAFKWDAQVGDECSLAQFAVVISRQTWARLSAWAEAMTEELGGVERELRDNAAGIAQLGMPPCIREHIAGANRLPAIGPRVIRYDFHLTTLGWKVSEANSDVPGGYTESTVLPRLMRNAFPQYQVAGSPADRLVEGLAALTQENRTVGLVAAPGYIEDQQIVAFLSHQLRARNITAVIGAPEQVDWSIDGLAHLCVGGQRIPVDVIFRFFQAEWLARIPEKHWARFFGGGKTPVCNPGLSIITESKRLWPLLHTLRAATPTLRALVAPSAFPQLSHLREVSRWVFKLAYSNNGDAVLSCHLGNIRHRIAATRAVVQRHHWIAQEKFDAVPLATPRGSMYPCIGVFTIDGRAAGIYGRVSSHPIIGYKAKDVAVLIQE